ncbi:uncharacterized protein LOC129597261 isoform X1 [Paramacrobiotus metropolitanus]|uniref:uncharacterized protein LOC129597261 isoform X1 n=1 Tax=Paramacrobiotus metropolitanus TaxID=2943436 RepID=UPI00244645D1|nr:uncharacterized protein LOC129597261 isoform X1 [Paramacrobiotus metropolitanus]
MGNCVTRSNDELVLLGPEGKLEKTSELSNAGFVTLMIAGYVPVIPDALPADLAACIRRCLCAKSENRATAQELEGVLRQVQSLVEKDPKLIDYVFLFYDTEAATRKPSKMSVQQMDAYNNTVEDFPVPVELQTKRFSNEFLIANNGIACRIWDPKEKSADRRTITWNVVEKTWRYIMLPSVSVREHTALAIQDKVYYIDNMDNDFKVLSVTDGKVVVLPKLPMTSAIVWEEIGQVVCGVQTGLRIIYIGINIFLKQGIPLSVCVESFSTVNQEWQRFPVWPESRWSFAAVALDECVYVLGGETLGHGAMDSCVRLNMRTRTWEKRRSMPKARMKHCAFVINKRIYIIGGWSDKNKYVSRIVDIYDPERNSWEKVAFRADNSTCEPVYQKFAEPCAVLVTSPNL